MEATLDVVMEISSLEPEITPDGARIQCGLNAQYKVWDRELLEVAEDAYSPAFDMEVNRQTLNLPALLDNKEETLDARMDFQAGDLVDVQFLPDFPSQYREGESISMEFPAQFITLYRDEEGNLQCAAESWTGNASIPAGENCRVTAALTGWHPLDASGREQRINLRLHTTANQDIEQITGLSIGDRKEVKEGRPSLILRRMDADSLWEFAKASGSTVDAIRKANQLETEPDAGQMLLIPIP